jgi:hypothetical protein
MKARNRVVIVGATTYFGKYSGRIAIAESSAGLINIETAISAG